MTLTFMMVGGFVALAGVMGFSYDSKTRDLYVWYEPSKIRTCYPGVTSIETLTETV